MVNLEQKRAINAFEACSAEKFGGKAGGEVVKKLPPLIRGNGMLGALAFTLSENNKDKGWERAFDAIRLHLKSLGKVKADNVILLQDELMKCDSRKLRDVTAETMLYLDYLRRFAKKG